MKPSSKKVVKEIVESSGVRHILDAPCGDGWLGASLQGRDYVIDGIDLYTVPPPGYRQVFTSNLDEGISRELPVYDCVTCCAI